MAMWFVAADRRLTSHACSRGAARRQVPYTFVDRVQLEADIVFLKRLLATNQIDNETFNNQRDHMIIQGKSAL